MEGQWQASGCTVNSSSNSYITITAPSTIYASFTLQYRYRNACGWSAWTPIYGSTRNCAAGEDPYRVIGFSSIYPNPVSNVLNISINTGALSQSTPILRNASIPAYSIRLYNLQSILVRQTNIQGDNIELNVSDLPNGIYVIHVIDSKGVKIGEHKVVIKH
ncbi:hypothetical protein FACS189411_15460 [Bacteroidia bacterium]|nr:hypothetical protein FACS189411_15460 [Bacteroidia bacterium]